MPYRRTTIRRKVASNAEILPEQVECLITGDFLHGALIPRSQQFAGPAFRDLAQAREAWRRSWRLVITIHRRIGGQVDCAPTMVLRDGTWLRHGEPCWAERQFGLPRGAKEYLAAHGMTPDPLAGVPWIRGSELTLDGGSSDPEQSAEERPVEAPAGAGVLQ